MAGELVLVTGGSGFVGTHCILRLVGAGYRVRTTVRSLGQEAGVRAALRGGGCEPGGALSFVSSNLLSDAGWDAAVADCDFVLHVASPFPARSPKDENDLIVPARDGALRVLRAARDSGVKRVVLTSSFAAIGYGHSPTVHPLTEEDWTDLNGHVSAYVKSKTLAERAAWDFIRREGGSLELSVVNPVGVLGPLLGPDLSASIELVRRLLAGSMPGVPRVSFGLVDVRDVADLHVRAMIDPAANGERFLAVGSVMSVLDMARVLKSRMGAAANRVPTRVLPNFLLHIAAMFDRTVREEVASRLGIAMNVSGEKARRVLGWVPRSGEDALVATAESLVRLGLLGNGGR